MVSGVALCAESGSSGIESVRERMLNLNVEGGTPLDVANSMVGKWWENGGKWWEMVGK